MVKKLVPVTALSKTHCSAPVDDKSGQGGPCCHFPRLLAALGTSYGVIGWKDYTAA